MYIAVWESQSPSPLALQKTSLLFEVLCVRYVALRSGSVSQTTMLLRLSRPYSYNPRPISKKEKKSKILISCRVCPKIKRNRNTIQKHEYDAFHFVWEDGFRGMHFVLQMPKRA